MPLASSALLPSVPGTLPATHMVSSHSFILVGTDLKHWKISIKKSCGRSAAARYAVREGPREFFAGFEGFFSCPRAEVGRQVLGHQSFAAGPHWPQELFLRGSYAGSFKSPPHLQSELY